jgi:hypothetical protein
MLILYILRSTHLVGTRRPNRSVVCEKLKCMEPYYCPKPCYRLDLNETVLLARTRIYGQRIQPNALRLTFCVT